MKHAIEHVTTFPDPATTRNVSSIVLSSLTQCLLLMVNGTGEAFLAMVRGIAQCLEAASQPVIRVNTCNRGDTL